MNITETDLGEQPVPSYIDGQSAFRAHVTQLRGNHPVCGHLFESHCMTDSMLVEAGCDVLAGELAAHRDALNQAGEETCGRCRDLFGQTRTRRTVIYGPSLTFERIRWWHARYWLWLLPSYRELVGLRFDAAFRRGAFKRAAQRDVANSGLAGE